MQLHYDRVVFKKNSQLIIGTRLDYTDMSLILYLIMIALMLMIVWVFINIK